MTEDIMEPMLKADVEFNTDIKVLSPKEIRGMISDTSFDPAAIEKSLSSAQVADFRRIQTQGFEVSKQKHASEIMANWVLGCYIDQMMTIIESTEDSNKESERAAIHCAKIFNLLEKQVTDLRRFAIKFPDQSAVEQLISKNPSWTLIRYLLRYETDAQRQDALKWMVSDGKFISAGDLKRIEEKKAANKEAGITKPLEEITDEVLTEKKEKALEKATNKDESPKSKAEKSSSSSTSKSDSVSTAKLLKQAERLSTDLVEVCTSLIIRLKRFDEIEDAKAAEKIKNIFNDKVRPELTAVEQSAAAVLEVAKEKLD